MTNKIDLRVYLAFLGEEIPFSNDYQGYYSKYLPTTSGKKKSKRRIIFSPHIGFGHTLTSKTRKVMEVLEEPDFEEKYLKEFNIRTHISVDRVLSNVDIRTVVFIKKMNSLLKSSI